MRALCNSKPCFFICGSNHACGRSHIYWRKAKEAAVDAKLKQASVRTACVLRLRVCRTSVSQYVLPPPAFLLLLLQLHCRQSTVLPFFFSKCSIEEKDRKEMNTDRQASIPVPDDGTSSKQTPCGLAETETVLHRTGHYNRYTLFKWIVIKTRV